MVYILIVLLLLIVRCCLYCFFFFGSLFLMNNFKVPFFRPTIATFWQAQKASAFAWDLSASETLHGSKSIHKTPGFGFSA